MSAESSHVGYLAFEAPLLCALTSLMAACLFFYAWRVGARPWFILLGVLGWLCWTLYFSLLAISAGPAPKLDRGDWAPAVRWAEIAGALLLACWLVLWTRDGIGRYRWYGSDPAMTPEDGEAAGC